MTIISATQAFAENDLFARNLTVAHKDIEKKVTEAVIERMKAGTEAYLEGMIKQAIRSVPFGGEYIWGKFAGQPCCYPFDFCPVKPINVFEDNDFYVLITNINIDSSGIVQVEYIRNVGGKNITLELDLGGRTCTQWMVQYAQSLLNEAGYTNHAMIVSEDGSCNLSLRRNLAR